MEHLTATEALSRLSNPDDGLLAEYWRTLPKHYFRVAEDPEAAKRHLADLVEFAKRQQ